ALPGTQPGKALNDKLRTSGLYTLVSQYEILWARIERHFKDIEQFVLDVKNGVYVGNEGERDVQSDLLLEESNNLSSSIEIVAFWHGMRNWLNTQDPLRRVPVYLDLTYKSSIPESKVLDNMVALYQRLGGQHSRLEVLDNQAFRIEEVSRDEGRSIRLKISGANPWPYFHREGGLHVWPNQEARGSEYKKTIEVTMGDLPPVDKVNLLPTPIANILNTSSTVTLSTAQRHVRRYDLKALTVYTQDTGSAPGPMRASGINRGGEIVLTEDGEEVQANIFRRYAALYYIMFTSKQLEELQPFLPVEDKP
ncbi:hypothetical protein K2X33_11110, partial [bacterium]|nr:hypothetical protein [bacterium]